MILYAAYDVKENVWLFVGEDSDGERFRVAVPGSAFRHGHVSAVYVPDGMTAEQVEGYVRDYFKLA